MGFKDSLYKFFEDQSPDATRARWLGRWTYIIAMVGYCVGLGNFWRFPYLCYRWGGVLFFIPYWVCLLFIGIPVALMEMVLGQKFQRGDVGVFRGIHPRLAGVGLASVLASFAIVLYYNVIIAWALIYLIASFYPTLPWSTALATNAAKTYKTCPDLFLSEEFFYKDIVRTINDDCQPMDTSTQILDTNLFGWKQYAATVITWIVVYFCMWKGVNSSSYVVWVTVPMPIFFIVVMVIKGLTLEGRDLGFRMYLKGHNAADEPPNLVEKLQNIEMWVEACGQIFFSLGICMGTMTSYASFNSKDKPIIGDSFLICIINATISFVAGFAVFSIVGTLILQGSPVSDKVASIGLAFVAYPAAIDQMFWPNLWAVMLSITLFTLGIDSAFSMLEATATVLQDTPVGKSMPRKLLALLLCVLGAIGSIAFSFNWGFTYFDVVDHYLNVYLMLLLGVLEVMGAGWVYDRDYAIKKANKASVLVLALGYWVSLLIMGLVSFLAIKEKFWIGIIIFWVLVLVFAIISFAISGLSLGDWFHYISLYGARRLSRTLTKLSRKDQDTREKWENVFDIWWCISIKYFVPFALWFLLSFSMSNDLEGSYGGYHVFWQWMGFVYPILGLLAFFISFIICTEKDPFTPDLECSFTSDEGESNPKEVEMAAAEGKAVDAE